MSHGTQVLFCWSEGVAGGVGCAFEITRVAVAASATAAAVVAVAVVGLAGFFVPSGGLEHRLALFLFRP